VYVDGADSSQSAAGVGVYFGPGHALNISRRVFGADTNNRAELEALMDAVWFVKCLLDHSEPKFVWEVRTDSRFALDCVLKWWPAWHSRGGRKADGAPAVHYSIAVRIARMLSACGDRVSLVWTPRDLNQDADSLAKQGKAMPRRRVPEGHPLAIDLAEGSALCREDAEWASSLSSTGAVRSGLGSGGGKKTRRSFPCAVSLAPKRRPAPPPPCGPR
jgi:ribonuclease HI